MVSNLNIKDKILIARAVFEILVTVLAERIYTSRLQALGRLKNIQDEEKVLVLKSNKLLDIGKITQIFQCYLIAKYKEFLRNNEKSFYKRESSEVHIEVLIQQSRTLLNIGKLSKKRQRSGVGIDSRIIEKLPNIGPQLHRPKIQLLHSSADV